ncbi:MAG TPA: BamA/TamA family outer membrane protein [Puia sp.]|nr:BamA/TamA family outer membrane protein [Puia sp.]
MFNLSMFRRRQVTLSFPIPALLLLILSLTAVFSCTVPRKYQYHRPFVFAVNVKVEGNQTPDVKKDLAQKLANQLDDSLRPQIVSIAGLYRRVMYPPVFDTANVRRSIGYMVALLNATGYFNPAIKDTIHRDTVHFRRHPERDQYRVTVDFTVIPGKQLRLDSFGYALSTPALQALAMQSIHQSLLRKGKPYSKQLMSDELDRLVTIFRNNGYYRFSKEDLVVELDTVVSALIDPNLDPFQQEALILELKRKREHPTIDVVVEQRPVRDSTHIVQYHIGHVTVYPDLPIVLEDTVTVSNIDTIAAKGFTLITRSSKFKRRTIVNNIYVRPDSLYRLENSFRTVNRFNQMGAWQQETMNFTPSDESDSILDATLKLYPAKKLFLNADYEVARNTNDIVTATNLFGINLNFGLRNRNTFRESVVSSSTLRGGVELGSDFIQTTQVSASHTISFPEVLPRHLPQYLPGFIRPKRKSALDSVRSVFNVNASYVDRHQFFTMRSVNGSFGYEWTRGNKSFLYRPINIEYTQLSKTDSFNHYLAEYPSLNLAFRSGLVLSQQFVYKSIHKVDRHTDFLSVSGESSGALFGLIGNLDRGPLWRFVKGEIDYRHHIDFRRTQLAFHAYAGAGWAYGREGSGWEQTLPFYKAFFAGGPNSMRAWQVRQLGLGSSKFYDTAGKAEGTFPLDRFGDVQLEGNVEYRFPLGTILGVKLLSAIYVDAGNIWDRHVLIDYPVITAEADKGSDFKFDRFYKELAVDGGTGLRFDFDLFLIRFDYAYKLKNPTDSQWFDGLRVFHGQFQLGIGYPF